MVLIDNNFYLDLPTPPVSVAFCIILFPPPPTTPPSLAFKVASPLSLYHPLPTSYPGVVRRPPGISIHPPPVSLFRLYLCPILRACFFRHVPRPFYPSCRPRPDPRSLSVPGGSPVFGPSVFFVYPPISLPL